MSLTTEKTDPIIKAALIEAASRVYAAGMEAANTSSLTNRHNEAREAVKDFIKLVKEYGETIYSSPADIDEMDV